MEIPKKIFQTSKYIPKENDDIYKNYLSFKEYESKGWEYNFYDNSSGEKFLKENFHPIVFFCFKILKPGAYKADLLRVCLIYRYGGIYADIKLLCNYNLEKLIKNRKEIYVNEDKRYKTIGLWNGFFASYPKNPYLNKIIWNIIKNVKYKYYGTSTLSITGPYLWGSLFIRDYKQFYENKIIEGEKSNILILSIKKIKGKGYILLNKIVYFSWYINNSHSSNYGKLWRNRDIYDLKMYDNYFKK